MREIKCERCGKEFSCKGLKDCWCLSKPYVRLDKSQDYKDCLCENCLEELYNASKNNNQG
jgi:hypothetical protein